MMRKILTICLIFLLLTIITFTAGCSTSSTRSGQSPAQQIVPHDQVFQIGEQVTSNYPTFKIKWSVTETIRGAKANAIVSSGNMFNPVPYDGNEYFLYKVEVSNIGNEKYSIFPMVWNAYANGVESTQQFAILPDKYRTLEYIDIMPGATTSGWILVEVPIGSSVRIYFEPFYYDTETVYVAV